MKQIKINAANKFEQHKAALAESSTETFSIFDDITLPVENTYSGSFNPLTQALKEMKEIFLRLGFSIADGTELEDDYHNITARNFPPYHPARNMQHTFYVKKGKTLDRQGIVLRVHHIH